MEGPSLVILKEELTPFKGKRVLSSTGNTKQPKEELKGRVLSEIETWGKVLFLTFTHPKKKNDFIITRTHFLLFGSYSIDVPKENRGPRLELKFKNGVVYFYSCSIKFSGEEYLMNIDPKVDVMSSTWDEDYVVDLMNKKKNVYLCDLFLDQHLFSGSGNIVKNEVLFNIRRHPLTKLSQIDKKDRYKLARAVREYCLNFYEWKKKYELRKHWQVYRKGQCPVCERKLVRGKVGKLERMEFYCPHCQKKELSSKKLVVHEVLPVIVHEREERVDH